MIIVAGWIRVEPEVREAYLEGCRAVLEQARGASGCLDFALTADLLEPGRVNVFERWESDEDLAAFRGAGPDDGQAAQILDASVSKYRISAVEAP
ncbi:putative quinol monooxygenase [Phytohabitans suffuscus]|uniref:Antibiotic biosynthesis monooxygenase n=1 Tax=Phytohabitans suffuscus TaxID=624315 RepID=A0A6F8YM50_9ACTN|nr:antibiotic biosynthesis monooxygenase family protein [Phytohabitans suffuscus]BCB87184.1 antibiotic biosynthesis monooxygenase [Phytohabitans suffuscus]